MIMEAAINFPTQNRYDRLLHILGEDRFKGQVSNSMDFILMADQGISTAIISNFQNHYEIPRTFLSRILHVSEPTLYRWLKAKKTLDRYHAVLVLELAELFLYGESVFESQKNFLSWLDLPNMALGGMTPSALLEIPGGIAKVKDLIGRIEFGIFS